MKIQIRQSEWKFLGPLLTVHLFLLLFRIDRQSLWVDEIMTLDVVTRSWSDAWRFFVALPEQHPLYYLLLRGWLIFGTSEVALRSLSAMFALASLGMLYFLARDLAGERVARVSSVLLCFSPFFLYYGQEARMYTLLAFLSLLATLLLLRWSRSGKPSILVAYGVVAALGVYTHFFFIFLMVAHLAFLLLSRRGIDRPAVQLAAIQAGVGVLYFPWAALILRGGPESQAWKGVDNVVLGLPYALLRFSLGYSEVFANAGWRDRPWELLLENAGILTLGVLAFGTLAFTGARELFGRKREDGSLLLLTCLVVPALLALLGSVVVILTGERYLMVSYPFYVILIGMGIVRLVESPRGHHSAAVAVIVLLALIVGRSLYRYYFDDEFGKEQWAEVAEFLRGNATPSDAILTYSGMTYPSLAYYYLRGPNASPIVRAERMNLEEVENAERLWLVLSHPAWNEELEQRLSNGREVKLERLYPKNSGIRVLLLAPGGGN